MPILSEISRRFHLLTTDAKPSPPRVPIEGYTHNLEPSLSEKSVKRSRSTPGVSEIENQASQNDVLVTQRQKSVPNDATPTNTEYPTNTEFADNRPSTSESTEQKRPGFKTKTKSRQQKQGQGGTVISYNIINSNGVKIGSRTNYICNVNKFTGSGSSNNYGSKPVLREMPDNVECLSNCPDEITLDDMFVIKTHLGHGWRDVARKLSYSEGQIQQFEENYRHRGIDEVIYQLLVDWKQANAKRAQIGFLVKALWACQEYDCVERLVGARNEPV